MSVVYNWILIISISGTHGILPSPAAKPGTEVDGHRAPAVRERHTRRRRRLYTYKIIIIIIIITAIISMVVTW